MKSEWKTVRSKASFHVWIYLSQDSLQQPKAKHSVFSSALPSTKRREQPCGLGHSQAINLVAKSLMYWCWWTSKPACCSLYHPLSFSQTLSLSSLGSTIVCLKDTVVMFCKKPRHYPSRGYAMIHGFVWTNLTHIWLTNTCKCTKKNIHQADKIRLLKGIFEDWAHVVFSLCKGEVGVGGRSWGDSDSPESVPTPPCVGWDCNINYTTIIYFTRLRLALLR